MCASHSHPLIRYLSIIGEKDLFEQLNMYDFKVKYPCNITVTIH